MSWYRHLFGAAIVVSAIALSPHGHAARDVSSVSTKTGPRLEILVFEAEACSYCEIFRRDVAPGYRLAPIAASAPLRFIDVGKVDLDRIGLARRVEILPTTVLMRDGQEVERIAGLTAADTYYVLIRNMIAKNE
jgi:hypothetical protein